jgi:hypothetical protein
VGSGASMRLVVLAGVVLVTAGVAQAAQILMGRIQ